MQSHSPPGPLPQPGQQVRWRHPRLALALGRFDAYGPGPFEVIGVIYRGEQGGTRLLVVSAESGVKEIDAAWLGPVTPAPGPGGQANPPAVWRQVSNLPILAVPPPAD